MSKIYKLTVLSAALAGMVSIAGAEVVRMETPTSGDKGRNVAIPAADARLKTAATELPLLGKLPSSMLPVDRTNKVHDSQSTPLRVVAHAKAAGSIQGYLGYVSGSYNMTQGWYNVSVPTSTNLWKAEGYYPSCGYVRDGKLFTWYHRTSNSAGLYELGLRQNDLTTGSQVANETYGLFDGYGKVVWNCAYDSDNDKVYVFTSRDNDINAYMTQVYDPKTKTFTRLGDVNDSDWPIAMAWCPADGNVYTLNEYGTIKKLDKNRGTFSVVLNTGHDLSEYSGSMVYSPKDKGFVYMCASYDDESVNEMGVISLTSNDVTVLGYTQYDEQWLILHTSDPFAVAGAPQSATFDSWNFSGAQLTGTMKVKMPTLDNNNNAISGQLFVEVTVDDTTQPVYDQSATPGAVVSVPLTLTEGMHAIHVRPYVYSGIDKALAVPLHVEKYVGNDTPMPPTNIKLTKNKVSWTASTATGANGGYVNTSSLRYNVYVNGEKMNTSPINGTQLDIALPGGAALYVAEVEAMAAGKTSARGESNSLQGDGPLALPVYLGPSAGETDMTQDMINLFTVLNCNNDNRTWIYDEQKEKTGGFYYLCQSDNYADDWLVLPAINFPDATSVYSFACEIWAIKHYFSGIERYEIGISPDINPEHMVIIKEAEDVIPTDNFQPIEVLFTPQQAGTQYIGIHCVSQPDQYRLYAHNFSVSKTESGAAAPAAVSNLRTEAAADGTLFITAEFDMPTVDISGNPLAEGTQVTATVASATDSESVTAAAGAHASVTVGAQQGMNTIVVTASSTAGQGGSTSAELFAGVDVPASVLLSKVISADNRTMTLEWSVPTRGENGGPVISDDCTYTIMRHNGQGWLKYKEVGNATTYSYTVEPNTPQEIVQLGVLASNAAGSSSLYSTTGDILGLPYGLPMVETWPYNGENVSPRYDPYMLQAVTTDLYPSWGFCDPLDLQDKGVTPNDSGIALTAYWLGQGQVTLPKFSTEGMNNVKVDLSMFFGAVTPTSIEVLGTVDNDEYALLATFTQSDGDGWQTKTIDLPAHMQNRKWVAITIRVTISSYSQYFLLDKYEITNYPGDDLAATEITGNTYGNVGEQLTLRAGVRNLGANTVALPQAICEVLDGADVISSFDVAPPEAQVLAGQEVPYIFTICPGADMLGNHTLRFSFDCDDEVSSNNSTQTNLKVFNCNIPVPQNLTGEATEQGAVLRWDEPQVMFGAEECVPGERGDYLGLFRNYDMDGLTSYALSGVNYPGRYEPIGFQVIPVNALPLPPLVEGAGENVFMSLASSSGSQDNWLVSPEIKGGTRLSFRMACASPCDGEEYMDEPIEIWTSPTNDLPSSFRKHAEFTNSEVKWKDCDVMLPENAKYFAIVYNGGPKCFCVFIDNIAYTPAQCIGDVAGYRVTRGGDNYQTMVNQRTWTDTSYDSSRPCAWNVCTVMNVNGEQIDSDPSKAFVMATGVDNILSRDDQGICGLKGYITVSGYAGRQLRITSCDGKLICNRSLTSDAEAINIAPGVYIVSVGGVSVKVMVR